MIEFRLPALGADMDEGVLLEWKIGPGDRVARGQVVAVVDTSKAAVDVECWQEGTVAELLAQPGERLKVGAPLAHLLEPGEAATPKVGAGGTASGRRAISPAARRLAAQYGIEADTLAGSGPQGAVTLEDVERARAAQPVAAPQPTDRSAAIRQTIAAAMTRSKREIPHYYVAEDICLGRALDWLGAYNRDRPLTARVLPAALLLKAVAVTLMAYPELNGTYRDGVFRPSPTINLGVAIALRQGGLVAPALLEAETMPLDTLMRALADLVARARAGTLKAAELGSGSVTVTNLGDTGSQAVFGVIYPPQVALIGFGRSVERPWVEDGRIVVRPVVSASLAADHRVSDGHRGALFLRDLADRLQRPEELKP